MIEVNAMGDACPIPVVKTKNAIKELKEGGEVTTWVDNEIAVQNLTKMAQQKGYGVSSEKVEEGKYRVVMTVGADEKAEDKNPAAAPEETVCIPDARKKNTVVAIGSDKMGEGNEELGKVLLKGFIYALTQLDTLPDTMLFYNGGAKITTEGSDSLEDLKSLEAQGVEILTCGTCLNYYNLSDQLKVGSVTNMYAIVETLSNADKILKP
jgi:selenium metabolism protein YedF